MDFLDPKKRRAHRLRLMTGYVLMGLAIALGTVILVYDAYGYGINTKTGAIIQNGLVFVGSQPGGAQILLDGQSQNSNTPARLVLPAKAYQLTLKKDGYRDWQRQFNLNEHSIGRYVYPLLLPSQLTPQNIKEYSEPTGLTSQSLDRRWLLVQRPQQEDAGVVFDEFDIEDLQQAPRALSLPSEILTNPDAAATLSEVEWSSDNRYLLIKRDFGDENEFLVFDREQPAESFNINRTFNIKPAQVFMRDKQAQQFYIRSGNGDIRVGERETSSLAQPFLSGVADFKPYGTRLVLYATTAGLEKGEAAARVWDNGPTYELSKFKAGSRYLLDLAQFQGDWYYGVGSSRFDRINIYKNPLDELSNGRPAQAMLALKLEGAQSLSFSANTRFLGAQAGQKIAVFDFELGESFSYEMPEKLAASLKWMDGHRWVGQSESKVLMADYDGANQHQLVGTSLKAGAYFNRDFESMFVVVSDKNGARLQVVPLLAGEDLPD